MLILQQKTALKNHSVYNVFPVPLMVAPVEESGGEPAFATPTSEPRVSNIGGTGFSDMEASVFRKLQEVHKMKFTA
jgi:DnaJ family protein C protein 17